MEKPKKRQPPGVVWWCGAVDQNRAKPPQIGAKSYPSFTAPAATGKEEDKASSVPERVTTKGLGIESV